ncbi:MAG: hypothetical protein PHG66_01285 [Candidatus Colwellbacteria bacterium]|nr:hypothetical protein [Candidatus Colwellbacteria bacterium]
MNKEDLEKYEQSLLSLEKRLETEFAEIPDVPDFGDGHSDMQGEEADEAVAADESAGIKDEIRSRIEDVRSGLNKIKEGTYGICEACGKPIEKEILNIVPESRLCKEDKLQ